jgi:CRP-like cAMP-binding protein
MSAMVQATLLNNTKTLKRRYCFITTMPCGDKISPDVHYIVIRLSSIMKPGDIAIYTGISQNSVLRILRYFALHGTIEDKKERKKTGVHLRDMDLEVSGSAFTLTISC